MAGTQIQERSAGISRAVRGLAAAVLGWTLAVASPAREAVPPALPTVALSALPVQAQETHARVVRGGPFPYAKDGSVFGNRERLLPRQQRGYYREYTVRTPGSRDRGARRLVCGGAQATQPDTCYYTEDHYTSFRRVLN